MNKLTQAPGWVWAVIFFGLVIALLLSVGLAGVALGG